MTLGSEEITNVNGIKDSGSGKSFNGIESSVSRVAGGVSEISLEGLKSSLKSNLLLDDIAHSGLNVSWEDLVGEHSWGNSHGGSVSEVVILAWEEHLDELIESESLVSITIEEGNEVVGLGVRNVVDSVVSQESHELGSVNRSAGVSVHSLESGSWNEIRDGAES